MNSNKGVDMNAKKNYFYFECDTVSGKFVIAIETEGRSLVDMIDAERDIKTLLHPSERVINKLVKKPLKKEWEKFRGKTWAFIGL
jgi:hypothetical protein